ncbi:MAG: hypothetical protein HXY41_01440 [Chloroflexi bacterium]|nr:hypothetical protein [Chloroflexota bacterium]
MDLHDAELDDLLKLALQQPAISVQQKQRAWERLESALVGEKQLLEAPARPLNRVWSLPRLLRAAGYHLYQLVFEEGRYEHARRDRHVYRYSGLQISSTFNSFDLIMPFRVTMMRQVL